TYPAAARGVPEPHRGSALTVSASRCWRGSRYPAKAARLPARGDRETTAPAAPGSAWRNSLCGPLPGGSRIAPPPVRRVGAGAVGCEMQYSVASIAGTLALSAMPSDACVSVPAPQRGDRGALPLDYSLDGRASWPVSWSDGSRSIASWSSGISRVIDAFCCPSSVLLVLCAIAGCAGQQVLDLTNLWLSDRLVTGCNNS